MKKIALTVILLALPLFCFAQNTLNKSTAKQPLQLTIKSDKQVYEVGEKIEVNVRITNVGSEEEIFFTSSPYDDYEVELSDSKATTLTLLEKIKSYKEDSFFWRAAVKILPNETKSIDSIFLIDWFGVLPPDIYTLKVLRNISKYSIPSNIITIKVVKSKVSQMSASEVVKAFFEKIKEGDWETICVYLSSDFLAKNKQEVLTGTYFKPSGRKDKTACYTMPVLKASESKIGKNDTVAVVTITFGEPRKWWERFCLSCIHLQAYDEVKLIKENNSWKVSEF